MKECSQKVKIILVNLFTSIFTLLSECQKDVVFLLDNSDFLTPKQYETQLLFVSNMVERLYDEGSRFAVVSFNDEAQVHISFQQNTDRIQLQNLVSKMPLIISRVIILCFYRANKTDVNIVLWVNLNLLKPFRTMAK